MSANGFLKYLCLSFVFMGSAYINSASAEGRCPPGQYPIGDQGVGGCAPIPGAGRSAPDENPGHWVKTWGAVAGSMNGDAGASTGHQDRKSTRLNSSHSQISYAVFCLKKKKKNDESILVICK